MGSKTAHIEPSLTKENGYCERFDARFRNEWLNVETSYSLRDALIPSNGDDITKILSDLKAHCCAVHLHQKVS